MKSRRAILIVIVFGGMAGLLFLLGDVAGGARVGNQVASPVLPVSRHREDPGTRDRFAGLDPALRKIVIQLEEANLEWSKGRLKGESAHKQWNDWQTFSREQISELKTDQIRALVEWVEMEDGAYSPEVREYRQALYFVWASREPSAARCHLMEKAEAYHLLPEPSLNQGRNPWRDEFSDDYHFLFVGYATKDPAAAWRDFQQDEANPRMKDLVRGRDTIPEIFRSLASSQPEKAWNCIVSESSPDRCSWMLEGYADGAPPGREWDTLNRQLIASLENRKIEFRNWIYRDIAERWITEDPRAALDWFAGHASAEEVMHDLASDWANGIDPFAAGDEVSEDGPDVKAPESTPSTEELRMVLELDLLKQMYESHKDRMPHVVVALDHLLSEGESELPARFILGRVETSFAPFDVPLLGLIPKIQDAETRNRLFKQVLQHGPFQSSDPIDPNGCAEAVRRLAATLDLPPDLRAEAEAVFKSSEIPADAAGSR